MNVTVKQDVKKYTEAEVRGIVLEARTEAHAAASTFFNTVLGGQDQFACGFAWVDIYKLRSNTKVAKVLQAEGIRKSYTGGL